MTGSRGPQSKPAGRRQRRNKPKSDFVLGKGVKKPKAPKDYLADTVGKWDAFWATDLAKTMREEQLPMIVRLFDRYDERERAVRVIRQDGRLTRGSQGQLVLHPLQKLIDSCEAAILQLEDRLGVSPKRGSMGGMGAGDSPGSLDDVNRRLNGDVAPETDENEVDPRDKVAGHIGG